MKNYKAIVESGINEDEQHDLFKALSDEHKIFVLEMIAHGHRQDAYCAAYPSASRTSIGPYNSACRLLATPAVKTCIQYAKLKAYKQSVEAMQQQYELSLTTVFEKRGVLAKIIRGQLQELNDKDNKDNKSADIKNIMRAIALDSQLEIASNKFL